MYDPTVLSMLSQSLRALSADMVEKAGSGHPGLPLGMADVSAVLFSSFLRFNAENPLWEDRDRFILSAGHGSALLYSLLYLTGYKRVTLDEIKNFRQLHSLTAGHPEHAPNAGIETTTGPLGQGIANAVGMALAARIQGKSWKTYVLAGDGCLAEGITQESITLAAHLGLSNLILLFDDNGITIDGPTSLASSENQKARFVAAGWETIDVDGHSYKSIHNGLEKAQKSLKPCILLCKTHIGYGAPTKQGTAKAHGAPLGSEEIAGFRKYIAWNHPPFHIPQDILSIWRGLGTRHKCLPLKTKSTTAVFPIKEYEQHINAYKSTPYATRKSSEIVLNFLQQHLPYLIGGSADLTPSNNTLSTHSTSISSSCYRGNYIHYGIREHAMGGIMNGLALGSNDIVPYGGTFLTFSDYCRPSIRLAALMGLKVIYVFTHDSIALGEDGPTHQPIEHLWSLRSIPNLKVFRPADMVETAECWLAALTMNGPSVLALSRQTLMPIRTQFLPELCSYKGAYAIEKIENSYGTILATGSEVSLALRVRDIIYDTYGKTLTVVSAPCLELFNDQPESYKNELLTTGPIITLEAGSTVGFHQYKPLHSFGIDSFGASGTKEQLFTYFGLTEEILSEKIWRLFDDYHRH